MGSIIKSIVYHPEQEEMEAEFYGGREREILKQCLCCGQYHPIYIGVCPVSGKMIAAEARRQAEEEERVRKIQSLKAKAKTAKEKYLSDHSRGLRNTWNFMIAMAAPAFLLCYGIVVIIFFVVSGNHFLSAMPPHYAGIGGLILVIWIFFWLWRNNKYETSVHKQADALYQRVLEGDEAEAG